MLSIILLQLFLVGVFIMMGIPHKFGFVKFTVWGLAVLELLITVWLVLLNEQGESIVDLLSLNSYIVLVFGGLFGFITVFMVMVRLMVKDKPVEDDGYTKFMFNQK